MKKFKGVRKKKVVQNCCTFLSTLVICVLMASANVSAEDVKLLYDLPSQEMAAALDSFAEKADLSLIYVLGDLENLKSNAISGKYTPEQALEIMLEGSGLEYEFTSDTTISIRKKDTGRQGASHSEKAEGKLLKEKDMPVGALAKKDQPEKKSTSSHEDDYMLEEVIVSATKRNEKIQDIPMSITAMNENTLKNMGAVSLEDYIGKAPGVSMSKVGAMEFNIAIRGVSTSLLTDTLQSTTAFYIDGLPLNEVFASIGSTDFGLVDINRVEVLNGPQGTLFGSGSMGGTIHFITNKPELNRFASEIETSVSTVEGGDMGYGVNAMVNVPVIEDKLALRAVAYKTTVGGWLDNSETGQDNTNSSLLAGARISALWRATDQLSVTTRLTYQKNQEDDTNYELTFPDGQIYKETWQSEDSSIERALMQLIIDYDMGWADLFSSSALAFCESAQDLDLTRVMNNIYMLSGVPQSVYSGFPPAISETRNESDRFLQEIRLSSKDDVRLKWLVGGFLSKSFGDRKVTEQMTAPGAGTIFGSDIMYSGPMEESTEETGLFGNFDYELIKGLIATYGLRWFSYDYNRVADGSGILAGGTTHAVLSDSSNGVTQKASLAYHVNDDVMVYTTISQGYRVGNPNEKAHPSVKPAYGPDEILNYEVGVKTSWFDNRLRANATLWYIDWTDIQLTRTTEPDAFGQSYNYIDNVGEAHTQGLETSLEWMPIGGLTFSTSFTLTEAEIDTPAPGTPVEKGNKLPGVPEFAISSAVSYSFPVLETAMAQFRIDHTYAGKTISSIEASDPTTRMLRDNHVVNLRAGLMYEKWDIFLSANNLFNDAGALAGSAPDTDVGDTIGSIVRQQPRSFGLNVRYRF